MKGQGGKTAFTVAIALVIILALVGSASAGNAVQLKIKGNGKLVDGARIFESDNDAVAERTLQVTLDGPGKLAYFDAGTVHAENTDGSIVADVDVTKIEVSGKSTGTGMVVANATVRAEGHNVLDDTGAVIGVTAESEIESFVDLEVFNGGTAEGTAFAQGTATASGFTAAGSVVDTSATGIASASGKASKFSDLHVEGEIEGDAEALDDGTITDPLSGIWAEAFGDEVAQGTARALGEASAIGTSFDGITVDSSAAGTVSASGTSTKGAGFDAEAGIEAHGDHYFEFGDYGIANIWTEVGTEGFAANGKASASASADGEADVEIEYPDTTPAFNAEADGFVKGSATSQGIGDAWADSEIEANVQDGFGIFTWEFPLPIENPNTVFIFVNGDLVDDSLISSFAGATGDAAGFKGSADASAGGMAESAGVLSDLVFSNSFAEGVTAASASATGLGDAGAGSAVISLDVIGGGGFIELLEVTDALPDGADYSGQQGFATIDLPNSGLAEISVIADFAFANGESPKDITKAAASAVGETGASGAITDMPTFIGGFVDNAQEDSFASGAVSATASTAAKADPFAASIIGSATGLGSGNDMLDASLIAGFAEAEGVRGQASASARGFTAANGTVEFDLTVDNQDVVLESHTQAAGVTNASATANGGFALSFANIGSANFENSLEDIPGVATSADLVDVSLIGGVSIADGKASALSSASGGTVSNGLFIAETEDDVELVNITGYSGAMSAEDTVATSVVSFGGSGIAAAGIGSANVVDWVSAEATGLEPSATVVDASLIGDFVLADGKSTAKAYAEGFTDANGIVNDTTFAEGLLVTGNSLAAGEVEGKAVGQAVCDPFSLSVIASVAVANQDSEGIKTLVEVSTIDSASLSTEKCGEAMGGAEGFTTASGFIELNETANEVTDVTTLVSSTLADGEAATSATTAKDDSLSLSLAGLTSVNVVVDDEAEGVASSTQEFMNPAPVVDGTLFELMPDQMDGLFEIGKTQLLRFGDAVEESRLLETDDMICNEIGPFLDELGGPKELRAIPMAGSAAAGDPVLVDVSAGGAAVFSSGTGTAFAGTDGVTTSAGSFVHTIGVDGTTEADPLLISNTQAEVDSDAAVRTFGTGIALGASGVASVNVVTYEPPLVEDGLPTANLVDVSVIGDIAFANSNAKADSAKVTVSSEGFTNSFGLVDDDESLSTSSSNAEGTVSGSAEAKAKSDPLTASLIASASTVDIDPVETTGEEAVDDLSLIVSASFAADDFGKASGEASGTTIAAGSSILEINPDVLDSLTSTTTASGTAATDVAVENGFGVGVSVIGSDNDVDFDALGVDAGVDDTSFMFNYAAGEGKKVKSSATTTDAATTSAGEYDEFDEITLEEAIDLDSNTVATGSGSAAVQVAGGHQGEALSFMVADQEDFAVAGTIPVSNAFVTFGIEVDGCDNSPVTSTATLSDGTLLADADGDYPGAGDAAAHVEFTGIDALAQLQSAKNIATLTVADSVPDLSYEPAGGADVDDYDLVADTNSQPNLISYTRYGEAVSDQANLFVPDLEILPILTF